MYLVWRLHEKVRAVPSIRIDFPDGCVGLMYVFRTMKEARDFSGKNTDLMRVEEIKNGKQKSKKDVFAYGNT